MKSFKEFLLSEARQAPLYHFTNLQRFEIILKQNKLLGGTRGEALRLQGKGKDIEIKKSISFTRDYGRQFIPGAYSMESIGFRIDQEKLWRDVGKKLSTINIGDKTYFADLDAKTKKSIEDAKKAGGEAMQRLKNSRSGVGGKQSTSHYDMAVGNVPGAARWESEERLFMDELPNFKKYISGFVLKSSKPRGRFENPAQEIAVVLIKKFSGKRGYDERNLIIENAIKLGIPIIYRRVEADPKKVKKEMINLFMLRKKDQNGFNEIMDKIAA